MRGDEPTGRGRVLTLWIDQELASEQGRWQMRAGGGAGGLLAMLLGAGLVGAVLGVVVGWLFGGLALVAMRSFRSAGRHTPPVIEKAG